MNRNTGTEVGNLRVGDRFYFVSDSAKKTYQLTEEKNFEKPSYNIVNNGEKAWPFDRRAANNRPVVFLRHTIPYPNEECMLYDLKDGDIFFFLGDVVTEYSILSTQGTDFEKKHLITSINSENTTSNWQGNVQVCYVRKSAEGTGQAKIISNETFLHEQKLKL